MVVFIIQKDLFIKNGIILTVSSLIIRSLAMAFRVYLSSCAGTVGIGIYQLITSVYAVFALICTSGITITVTRLTADVLAKGSPGKALFITEKFLIISLVFSSLLSALLFFSSDFISVFILSDDRCAAALMLLAPSLPFMSFSAVLRGYFSAKRKMIFTAAEQLLEQLAEIGVCIIVFSYFSPQTPQGACCAAVSGTTAAELLSFVYSLSVYIIHKKRLHCRKEPVKHIIADALPVALPCTANSGLRSALSAIENILIPAGLIKYGADSAAALGEYGIITGLAMPVIVFPSVFILPFSSLIIPEMSQANVLNHKNGIRHMSERMTSAILKYSLPVMFVMIFFSRDIGNILYSSEKSGFYIAVLAPVIPLMYLDSGVDGILKGLNEQTSYFIFNLIDSIIRVILTWLLLPKLGALGIIVVILFSELLNTTMSFARLIKVTRLRFSLTEYLLRPVLCSLLPCITIRMIPGNSAFLVSLKLILCLITYGVIMAVTSENRKVFRRSRTSVKTE